MDSKQKAFEAFINHLMVSKGFCCFAPANRYCTTGKVLKEAYSKALREGYYEFRRYKKR